jgi:hypothetical protein
MHRFTNHKTQVPVVLSFFSVFLNVVYSLELIHMQVKISGARSRMGKSTDVCKIKGSSISFKKHDFGQKKKK